MTHRLATNYAKNYCNRTLIVKVIVENVFLGDRVYMYDCKHWFILSLVLIYDFYSSIVLLSCAKYTLALLCCIAVILMEGGTEFDLKAIDADSEYNKNTGSDKQLNSR